MPETLDGTHGIWKTPLYFFKPLYKEFDFDFDPCPINPPYDQKTKEAFIMKAIEESELGKLCVMLLPVSTSSKIFHEHIQPKAKEIRFIKGRINFIGINSQGIKTKNKCGKKDSMLVVFDGR